RRLPQCCAVPALAHARARRGGAPGVHTDDPGARHARHRPVARRAAGEDGVLERLQGARRVVEPDTSVLTRVAAFVVLAAAVVTWDALAPHLAPLELWPTVAVVAAAVMPATLGLIYLALPLWSWRWTPAAALAFGLLAVVTWKADLHLASNFAKLAA